VKATVVGPGEETGMPAARPTREDEIYPHIGDGSAAGGACEWSIPPSLDSLGTNLAWQLGSSSTHSGYCPGLHCGQLPSSPRGHSDRSSRITSSRHRPGRQIRPISDGSIVMRSRNQMKPPSG